MASLQSSLVNSSNLKKRKMKRDGPDGNTSNPNPNLHTTLLDPLLMPIAKIESKHRKVVSAILLQKLAEYYGLGNSAEGELMKYQLSYRGQMLTSAAICAVRSSGKLDLIIRDQNDQ